MIKPISIGKVRLRNNLVLAPMSGVTNTCFRRLMQEINSESIGLLVTEFVSIEGMTRENPRSLQMMKYSEVERPLSIQIFGHDINRMVDAAMMVEDAGADIIDINCGCPVPKVVRRGGGCELMRQPDHLKNILSAVYQKVSIPLTLKIRSGWDESSRNALEVAKMAEGCGISMLAVHGRTRKDLYRGEADWDIIEEVADNLSIPVIGSGDVVDYQSASVRLRGKIAGLMIGRAAISNPWVFSEISTHAEGKFYREPTKLDTIDVIERYRDILFEEFPEKAVIGKLKQIASQATRRIAGSAHIRKALCQSKNVAEYSEILRLWREDMLSEDFVAGFNLPDRGMEFLDA